MASIKETERGNYVIHEGEPCEVRDIAFESDKAVIRLSGIFSGKDYSLNMGLDDSFRDIDITRKCGHVISKKDNDIEIMDSNSFETFKAAIDKSLFEEAAEGDQVTYIQFNNITKVLEVRK